MTIKSKKDVRNLTLTEIEDFLLSNEQKKFRAKQVYEWLWQKSAQSFNEMTNLSKEVRNLLEENFTFNILSIKQAQISKDRTIKNAFQLYDNNIVEGVLIPTKTRMTACISSQVGCSLTCSFCATGRLERLRNLEAYEIYDQIALIKKQAIEKYNVPLSNIVYMGMGEPLLNYRNVMESINKVTSARRFRNVAIAHNAFHCWHCQDDKKVGR